MLVLGGVFIVMVSMVVMVLVGVWCGVGRTPSVLRTYKGDFLRV